MKSKNCYISFQPNDLPDAPPPMCNIQIPAYIMQLI